VAIEVFEEFVRYFDADLGHTGIISGDYLKTLIFNAPTERVSEWAARSRH